MNRKRGSFTLPEEMQTTEKLSTKKELAQRGKHPTCPYVPVKFKKNMSTKECNQKPTPLAFNNNVTLSPMYDAEQNSSYLDQVFVRFGNLGEGSFGKVYRVKSKEDKKMYAVKRLKANISFKDRFAEVKNNETIGFDPNCVQFFMAWEENCETFLLLEYCDMSLADYAKKNNEIEEDLLWNLLYDMCKALNFLHKRNLLHLDVKPANIMMKKGYFKLGDFGLLADLQANNIVHKSTLSDGDSKYLAMEVLDGVYTTGCDIFGLGISILELATDIELPDHGPLWHQLRNGVLPPEFYEGVSLGLKILVERMISNEYKKRPAANKMLAYHSLKSITKRDAKFPRVDFAAPFVKEEDSYIMPLSPIHFNNNEDDSSTTTPPCGNRTLYDDDDCGNIFLRGENEENGMKYLGRRSLFNRGSSMGSPLNRSDYSSFEEDCSMLEADRENSLLASVLCETGMEIDGNASDLNEYNGDSFMTESVITSTPVLKTKQARKMPKSKLSFE